MFKSIKGALSLAEQKENDGVQGALQKTLIDLRDLRYKLLHLGRMSVTASQTDKSNFLPFFHESWNKVGFFQTKFYFISFFFKKKKKKDFIFSRFGAGETQAQVGRGNI